MAVSIWVACLVPVPETPLSGISMIDKWTHTAMYAALCLCLWCERMIRHRAFDIRPVAAYAIPGPLLMGGAVELAQAWLTFGNRSGDWLDAAANALGVGVGSLSGILLVWCCSKAGRGKRAGMNS